MNFVENLKKLDLELPEAKAPVVIMLQLKFQEKCCLYQDKFQ